MNTQRYKWENDIRHLADQELVVLHDVSHFPAGDKEFVSPHLVIALNTWGAVSLRYDHQTRTFQKNCVAVVCPNHLLYPQQVSEDYQATLIVVSYKFYNEMRQRTVSTDHYKYHNKPACDLTSEQFERLMRIVDVIDHVNNSEIQVFPNKHELLVYMLDTFFEILSMYRYDMDHSEIIPPKSELVYNKFCELFVQNYREHKDVQWYADQLHLTPKYFSQTIRTNTGHTAGDWIQNWLIARSKKLLMSRPDLNIQAICDLMGFDEQASFTRFFKRSTGVAPKRWRRENQ